MTEILNQPRSWTLTLLERELKAAAASTPLSRSRVRILRWLSQLPPDEADLLWGRSCGQTWTSLATERDGVSETSIAHRLYLPALEHLRTIATLDTFERMVADHTGALRDAGRRLECHLGRLDTSEGASEPAE